MEHVFSLIFVVAFFCFFFANVRGLPQGRSRDVRGLTTSCERLVVPSRVGRSYCGRISKGESQLSASASVTGG